MAQNSNSAEAELLKTIEGADPSGSSGSVRKAGSAAADPLAFLKGAGLPDLVGLKDKLLSGALEMQPAFISKALVGLLIVLGAWNAIVVTKGVDRLGRIPRFEVMAVDPRTLIAKEVRAPLREETYYDDIMLGRNIFTPFEEKKVEPEKQAPQIQEMIKDLKVVGISWSDEPKDRFVMIEDTAAQVTYFLREKEMLSKSRIEIKTILPEKAVLRFGDEEIDIR